MIMLSVARIKKGEKPIFRMRTAVERRIGASVRGMGIFFCFSVSRTKTQEDNCARTVARAAPAIFICSRNGIQYDVDNRTDQGCCHPKPRISLRGDEIVHAHGQQGEERAECINRHVGIGVGKCCLACAEPLKKRSFQQKKQNGKRSGKNEQHGKACTKEIFCFFLILCSETHRKQDGASDTDQCCKRRKQRDDGRADAGACQGNISDLRDISDINAINDAVKNVDKLREHKGDRGSQNQSRYRVVSEIIRVFFHKNASILYKSVYADGCILPEMKKISTRIMPMVLVENPVRRMIIQQA